jgi:hypothetical protein
MVSMFAACLFGLLLWNAAGAQGFNVGISGLSSSSLYFLDATTGKANFAVSVDISSNGGYCVSCGVTIQITGATQVRQNLTLPDLRFPLGIVLENPGTHVFSACPWWDEIPIKSDEPGQSPPECTTVVFDLLPSNPPLLQYPMPDWLERDCSLDHVVLEEEKVPLIPIRMAFVGDLRPMMDGVKMTRLQQFELLPRDEFDVAYWDLTCDSEKRANQGPGQETNEARPRIHVTNFQAQLDARNVPVITLCTKADNMKLHVMPPPSFISISIHDSSLVFIRVLLGLSTGHEGDRLGALLLRVAREFSNDDAASVYIAPGSRHYDCCQWG